uniref:Peptidase C1A papain C-terminal domain-containing protein n=1 Tax=Leersia perrieri TaxID=77586 RepID=A0A0D9XGV7_9ORYZ
MCIYTYNINIGSCCAECAYSAVGAVEGINAIETGKLLTLSVQQVIDCAGAGNCNVRSTYDAFQYAIENGITVVGNYPAYDKEKNCTCRFDPNKPPIVKITGISFVKSEEDLMQAVYWYGPVSVLIEASSAFMMYKEGVFTGPCGTALNHAVLVVGYGKIPNGTRYWIVKNSWGQMWGEKGYIRMVRDIEVDAGICGITTYAIYPTGVVTSPAAATAAY